MSGRCPVKGADIHVEPLKMQEETVAYAVEKACIWYDPPRESHRRQETHMPFWQDGHTHVFWK